MTKQHIFGIALNSAKVGEIVTVALDGIFPISEVTYTEKIETKINKEFVTIYT